LIGGVGCEDQLDVRLAWIIRFVSSHKSC
jgi:hypothetical protein